MLICLTLVLFMMAHLISVEMICGTYYSEFNFCHCCCGTAQCFNHNLLPDMHFFPYKIFFKNFVCPTYPNFFGHVIGNKEFFLGLNLLTGIAGKIL